MKSVKLQQKGQSPDGITIESAVPEVQFIRMYGPKSSVDAIKDIPVELDIDKIDKSGKVEVDVKKPEGITKVTPAKLKIQVKVSGEISDVSKKTDDTKES